MDNDHHDDNVHNTPPHFPDGSSIAATLQNVFRNISHAFTNHPHADPPDDDVPALEYDSDTDVDTPSTSAAPPIPSASTSADVDMPSHSQTDSRPATPYVDLAEGDQRPVGRDRGNVDDLPPLEPIAGTRRARVHDDVDDARDRRHPSERVGAPPPFRPALPPRIPGLFAPLFGLANAGANRAGGDAPPERVHTGEATADQPPAGDHPPPPRGPPFLTAGVTLTIPLFGAPPPNQGGPPPPGGAQNGVPNPLGGMDPAAREEFFRSFAQFFQEFQAMEEGREDPERAKKLMAGLEVVPLGLVKRLERVGGAPGGHVGDATDEGTAGCAICWDTLLDAESDTFIGQHSSSTDDAVEGQGETHTERHAMDIDEHTASAPSEAEAPTPPPSEEPTIITLPCAHVFHASCLLPWFTRARQATCPTCRFNIDPENLTYTPRRPVFPRTGPIPPENAGPNPAPAGPQAAPEEAPATGIHPAGAAAPVDPANTNAGADPAPAAAPPDAGGTTPGQAPGGAHPGPGFNPFLLGVPILSIPAFQIPLRQPVGEGQAPGGDNGNQGPDVLTIGVDMFIGGPPPHERGADPGDNAEGAGGIDDHEEATPAAGGEGTANPNIAHEFRSLMEAILRSTRDIIPQMMNAQGPPGMDVPPADGAQPQPQAGPAPEAAGPRPAPAAAGGPRAVPNITPFIPNIFRSARFMPPRREPKTWTLPPAPGLSLRERVELREREQGLRCSDTSCGIGPSDEDPYPDPSASLTKQVSIRSLPVRDKHDHDEHDAVCLHKFHPACLVSAERVAGRGEKDEDEPEVEVSCPKCRAGGCIAKDEWRSGEEALEAELTSLDA